MSATITVPNTAAGGAAANNRKNIIIKYCAPFTNCISKINNTQIDNAKDTDIVMPMHNDNYYKTSGSLWHYYRDEPFLGNGTIADFTINNNNSALFKFKTKIADTAGNYGTKNVKIRVPLKYLNTFWECH